MDDILDRHYAATQKPITVAYRGKYYSPRYLGKRKPAVLKVEGASDSLLKVNKQIAATARKIKAKYPIKIIVQYHEDHGFEGLQKSICSYANAAKLAGLRAQVSTIVFSGLDRDSYIAGMGNEVDIVLRHFPNVKEIFFQYSFVRQVYECYSDYSETDTWKRSDGFKTGAMDSEMDFPIYRLSLHDIAQFMLDNGKGDVKLVLRSIIDWYAKGRGCYGAQVSSH